MKLIYVIFLILPLSCYSFPSSEKPIVVPEQNDLTAKESSQITKRSGGGGGGSGSFDFITHLKSSLIGGFGKASASLSSGSSGSSSGPKSHGNSYGHGNSVDFDPWSLKKSVLNTIFQAVKAITGGVTAIKGQLIKGSGYAIAASGNLVASSGDKVTEVGKAIVNSAQLVHPPPKQHGHGGGYGGEHPFAKFSSLSGASSGSSSGGGHPATSVEVHGETVETYDIPTGPAVHHQAVHYGPPPVKTNYLPVHGGGYSNGPYAGAVAYEGPESYNNYNQHEHKGPISSHNNNYHNFKETAYPLTKAETQKATLALKEIIHLLPFAKTATKTITATTSSGGTTSTGHDSNGHNTNHLTGSDLISQHDNNDNNNYDHQSTSKPFKLGPVDTVEVTQSLTTAYGLPKDFEPNNTGMDSSSISNGYNLESNKNSNSENTIYNNHPFDVYEAMSNKYKTQQQQITQNQQGQSQSQSFNNQQQQQQQNNNNYNSYSGSNGSFNPNSINSIGPLLVAIGATNTYPYKRHVNNQISNEYDAKYNPDRVNLYLRELNPQLIATIASTNQYSNQPVPLQFPIQQTLPLYPTQLPSIQNPQYNQNNQIIQTVTARNDRPFRKHLPPGLVHHIKTKGKKILKNNSLGSLPRRQFTTAHGFDGQNMFVLQ